MKPSTISGVAGYLDELKKYGEEVPYNATESWLQRKDRLKMEKREQTTKRLEEGLAACAHIPYQILLLLSIIYMIY